MNQSMSQIIRARSEALLAQFHTSPAPPKMALGGLDIRQNMTLLWTGAWEVDQPDQSFFWIHPTDATQSSVWAKPGYGPYRDAYKRFITRAYGIAHPAIPGGFDVDHLQAKETTPAGAVIRLEAVARGSNRSHGGGVEKRMGNSTVTAGRRATNHTPGSMTWLVAMKLAGVLSPTVATSASSEARRQAAISFFVSKGWNRGIVEQGMEDLVNVINRR